MLLDFVALWEAQTDGDGVVDHLDIVAASRTIDGVQETSPGILRKEFVENLPQALIAGLASRGLVDVFGSRIAIHTPSATRHWGLCVADFLANTLYHRSDARDAHVLSILEKDGKLAIFEALGSFEERRAHIAARDRNFTDAAIRWLKITAAGEAFARRRRNTLTRIVGRVLTETGTRGPEAFLEGVLDGVHRCALSRAQLYSALKELEDILCLNDCEYGRPLLLRLRGYMLLIAQHRGDVIECERVLTLQEESLRSMAMRADLIPVALETQLRKSESAVNALTFAVAKSVAEQHLRAVDDLESLWAMVLGTEQNTGPQSTVKLRAQMNLLRCEALSCAPGSSELRQLLSRIEGLFAVTTSQEERNRLLSYEALCLLRTQNWDSVIDWMGRSAESKGNPFTLLWRGRALNDCILAGVEVPSALNSEVREALSRAVDCAIREKEHDHPFDLLLRELALVEARDGSVKKAKADLKLAETWLLSTVLECPIRNWLTCLNRAHAQYIHREPVQPILGSEGSKEMQERFSQLPKAASDERRLLELRLASPY